jgi:hypothetical protein
LMLHVLVPAVPPDRPGTVNGSGQSTKLPSPLMVHELGLSFLKVTEVEPLLAVPPEQTSHVGFNGMFLDSSFV